MRAISRRWDRLSQLQQRRTIMVAISLAVAIIVTIVSFEIAWLLRLRPSTPFVRGGGSSLLAVLLQEWMTDYNREMGVNTKEAIIWRYNITSSLLGWQSLLQNDVLFSGTDDPLLRDLPDVNMENYITFPLARGAISINHNVPECTTPAHGPTLSFQDLIDVYHGELTTWKELHNRHPVENPCLANISPTQAIIAFHRTQACGSNYIVQNGFNRFSPAQWAPAQLQWTCSRVNPGNVSITRWENMQLLIYRTPYSLAYLPYATTVKEFNVLNATVINPGGYPSLPTSASIQNSAEFPDDQLNVTCPNCWPFIGSGYFVIPRHTIVPAVNASNSLQMNSCLNLRALVNFFTWGLEDDVSNRAGGAFVNLSPAEKQTVLSKFSELTCNGKNVLTTDWSAHIRRANIAILVVVSLLSFCLTFAAGIGFMKYRERQDVRRMEVLARMGDEFYGFGLDSHLLQDFSQSDALIDAPMTDGAQEPDDGEAAETSPKQQRKGKGSSDGNESSAPNAAPSDESLVKVMIPASELTIGHVIGSGSFGEVYTGMYKHKLVAIKRIASNLDATMAQSFLQEVRAMVQLEHPNILRLLAIAVKKPYTYIVSEYCKFGSLEDYLKNQGSSCSVPNRIRFAVDAARGMRYLHSKGISHRDLKLNNLLVTESRTVKVGDLGTASTAVDVHRTRVGTLDYSAPEVLDGQAYTNSCDVYSFSICLWSLFSNQPLYPGWTMYDIITKVVPGARPPIDVIPSAKLRTLIEACWSGSPASRPSFDAILSSLEELQESDFVQLS